MRIGPGPGSMRVASLCGLLLQAFSGWAQQPAQGGEDGKAELVQKLQAELRAAEGELAALRLELAAAHGLPGEPALVLRAARALQHSSWLHHMLEAEGGAEKPWLAPAVVRPLEEAAELCRRALEEWPGSEQAAEVALARAELLRALGRYEDMVQSLMTLLERHPRSPAADEALLILGDYQFDRSDLDQARRFYERLLARPSSCFTDPARYKLAWIQVNQASWAEAVGQFERVAASWRQRASLRCPSEGLAKVDLRREALADMTFALAEAFTPAQVRVRLDRLQLTRAERALMLERLARRWFVKERFPDARAAYRELLELTDDEELKAECRERLTEQPPKR